MWALLKFAAVPPIQCDPNTANGTHGFFGFAHWWKYLHHGEVDTFGKCVPTVNFSKNLGDVWSIGLAVVDILLFLAGLVAFVSIVIAGVQYMSTMGNAEKGVSARKRIVNSIIGLAIVLIATTLVNFIGNSIK